MRNLWIQTENAFATWVADLDVARGDPEALMSFASAVLRAGAEHQVFEVVSAPLIEYELERDGDLVHALRERYRAHGVVDLFGLTGAAMAPDAPQSSACRARLSWYDADDRLVDGPCTDLGTLLQSLEPTPGSIPNGFMKHYPPVRVTGPRLDYAGGATAPKNYPDRRPVAVRFAIHSDIWFPWVFGSAHPECDHERMFDNRELAARHTPRLDAFLLAAAEATSSIGGRWYIDDEETGENAILWLDEDGVDLESEPPAAIMPASALDAEWF